MFKGLLSGKPRAPRVREPKQGGAGFSTGSPREQPDVGNVPYGGFSSFSNPMAPVGQRDDVTPQKRGLLDKLFGRKKEPEVGPAQPASVPVSVPGEHGEWVDDYTRRVREEFTGMLERSMLVKGEMDELPDDVLQRLLVHIYRKQEEYSRLFDQLFERIEELEEASSEGVSGFDEFDEEPAQEPEYQRGVGMHSTPVSQQQPGMATAGQYGGMPSASPMGPPSTFGMGGQQPQRGMRPQGGMVGGGGLQPPMRPGMPSGPGQGYGGGQVAMGGGDAYVPPEEMLEAEGVDEGVGRQVHLDEEDFPGMGVSPSERGPPRTETPDFLSDTPEPEIQDTPSEPIKPELNWEQPSL